MTRRLGQHGLEQRAGRGAATAEQHVGQFAVAWRCTSASSRASPTTEVRVGLTMAINVPLNNELAAGTPDTLADAAAVRAAYEDPWTTWNLVRTIASTLAFTFAAASLYHLGRGTHSR